MSAVNKVSAPDLAQSAADFLYWFQVFIGEEGYGEINCVELTALREALENAGITVPCGCSDEGRMCAAHEAEAMREHAYLRGQPRHAVFNDAQAIEERNQELRDCGRGHLVRQS